MKAKSVRLIALSLVLLVGFTSCNPSLSGMKHRSKSMHYNKR